MKQLIVAALLASVALAHGQTATPSSATKKDLVQKLMTLQQPGFEALARNLVEQPALAMLQAAGRALPQVPADRREATGKAIEADIRKYVDDALPIVRDRAVKLAPSTVGAAMEEKFSEDELRQLIAWLESPISKKYAQFGPEIQNTFVQKLVAESRPSIEPKLKALGAKVRTSLGVPAASAAASGAAPAKKPAGK
jgi:hypothetical protein